MTESTPRVSVLMPVYNGGRFLRPAVESILAQTFGDLELIVVNDGSTDDTSSTLRSLAASDPRVRLVEREQRGLVATLNELMTLARAPLLSRMDADDLATPDRLARQVAHMDRTPDCVLLGAQGQYMDESGHLFHVTRYPTDRAEVRTALRTANCLLHPSTIFRREAVEQSGPYRRFFENAEDYDFHSRLARVGAVENLPDVLIHYRQRSGSITFTKMERMAQLTAVVQALNAAPDPDALFATIQHLSIPDALLQLGIDPVRVTETVAQHLRDTAFLQLDMGFPHLAMDTAGRLPAHDPARRWVGDYRRLHRYVLGDLLRQGRVSLGLRASLRMARAY